MTSVSHIHILGMVIDHILTETNLVVDDITEDVLVVHLTSLFPTHEFKVDQRKIELIDGVECEVLDTPTCHIEVEI